MSRKRFNEMNCGIAQTLDVLGDWWTLLIVRDAFLGVRRFDDFQRSLGVARNVLTDRLRRLVEAGVLERVPTVERADRFEYRLTRQGRDLGLALSALREWGDRYLSDEPPVLLRRRSDGHPVVTAYVPEGADVLRGDEVEVVPGPGWRPRV